MSPRPVSPDAIAKLTSAHWALKALAVAVELGIFTYLARGQKALSQISDDLGVPIRSLERVLNANAALGFLEKAGDAYCNSEIGDVYLVDGAPHYLGDFVILSGVHGYAKWTRFKECVLSGVSIDDLDEDFRHGEEKMQYFVRAMHNNARGPVRFMLSMASFDECSHVLDLGGGSGVYSIALAEEFGDLRATVVDFPPVCKVAREYVSQSSARDRIDILEADVLVDNIDLMGDVVLISQVLHGMSEQQCQDLITRSYGWTDAHGRVIVHDFLLDDSRAAPLYPALFALNMLITSREGNAYTEGQVASWLANVGYKDISFYPTPGPSTFVIGWKP